MVYLASKKIKREIIFICFAIFLSDHNIGIINHNMTSTLLILRYRSAGAIWSVITPVDESASLCIHMNMIEMAV